MVKTRIASAVSTVARHRLRAVLAGLLALVVAGAVVAATTGSPPRHRVATVGEPAVGSALQGKASIQTAPAPPPTPEAQFGADASGSGSAAGGSAGSTGAEALVPAPASPAPQTGLVVPGGPKVVKTGTMRVQVTRGHYQAAFDMVATIATRYGGFVSGSSSQTENNKAAQGSVTVRVPAANFDAARADLAHLGTLDNEQVSGQDVTSQLVDVGARIQSLQAQEQAFETLLSQARNIGDVLNVQGQLFNVRQQIEQLQAQQANLDDSASFATITVALFEPGAATVTPTPVAESSLARSWHQALHGGAAVIGGMVVVLGYGVPLALLALLAFGLVRLVGARRATRAGAVTS